jgi:hypothetical protein
MKKIIHFYPNVNYAEKFIQTLKEIEAELDFKSIMVNKNFVKRTNYQIDFVISKKSMEVTI